MNQRSDENPDVVPDSGADKKEDAMMIEKPNGFSGAEFAELLAAMPGFARSAHAQQNFLHARNVSIAIGKTHKKGDIDFARHERILRQMAVQLCEKLRFRAAAIAQDLQLTGKGNEKTDTERFALQEERKEIQEVSIPLFSYVDDKESASSSSSEAVTEPTIGATQAAITQLIKGMNATQPLAIKLFACPGFSKRPEAQTIFLQTLDLVAALENARAEELISDDELHVLLLKIQKDFISQMTNQAQLIGDEFDQELMDLPPKFNEQNDELNAVMKNLFGSEWH